MDDFKYGEIQESLIEIMMMVWGGGGGGKGVSCFAYDMMGMLVVSLRGVNFGFWFHIGCSGGTAIICSPYVAVKALFRVSCKEK